ncbi:MAG: choline dehydrogenase [Gammaproteobacteria bacterium]|jgi:choline dehydrogenase
MDLSPRLHIPVGNFKTMHNPGFDRCYLTELDPGIAGRRLQWPRGKVLGGSSALNGFLYLRGQPEDYNRWAELGNPGWGFRQVLLYFKKSQDLMIVVPTRCTVWVGCKRCWACACADRLLNILSRLRRKSVFLSTRITMVPGRRGAGYFQQTAYCGFRWLLRRSCIAFLAYQVKAGNAGELKFTETNHKLVYQHQGVTSRPP